MHLVPTAPTSLQLCLCHPDRRVYFIEKVLCNTRDQIGLNLRQHNTENNVFRAKRYGGV